MNRPLALVAIAFVTSAGLLAQAPPAGVKGKERDRVGERAQSMRETLGTGRQVISHVRVSVRLKNGNKLRGVVKDGRLVERVDGLQFVDAQAKEPGAGIRLWYSSGARNYVFVPFEDLAEYQVLQRMTAEQLEQLEAEMMKQDERRAKAEAEARAEAERAAAAKGAEGAVPETGAEAAETTPPAGETVEPAPGAGKGKKTPPKTAKAAGEAAKPAATAETELQRAWFALLQDYPPAAGWNQKKRDEIARRFVVVGAKPDAKEQRFVDQYEQWVKACKHFGVDAEKKPAEGAESGEEQDDRRSRRKKQ